MSNYTREKGDDLLSKDKRLIYNWRWSRIAAKRTKDDTKNWTHFQCSKSEVGDWELKAVQWGYGDGVNYTAEITYNGDQIAEKEGFDTRLDAQIGAESLLEDWIRKQYQKIIINQ